MPDTILRVEKLGKRYRIGAALKRPQSGREALLRMARSPFQYLARVLSAPPEEEILWALRDVSFEVRRGEVLGIIGRNGAGKSTLLRILSRITEPTEGRAELRGRVGSLLEVGVGFHPELTGRENIYLNGTILGMKKWEIDGKFDEIVAFAETEKFLDTPVKRYSSGMYVRLAFAVAAHLEPEILVVDEVLAVGDAAFQKKCLGKMGDVAKGGRTVLFVSHNMAAIRNLCGRAILLDGGRLVREGSASEVMAAYLGGGRINRAEAEWDERDAPGTEKFFLSRVRVVNEDGATVSEIASDEPVRVEIDFLNKVAGAKMGATIAVFNEEGACVFSSLSNREPVWQGRGRPQGRFRSVCRIPGNLLADGNYTVTVLLWADGYTSVCRAHNVVEFRVHDAPETRGDFLGAWMGVVRPRLDWRSDYLGDASAGQTRGGVDLPRKDAT